MTNLTTNATAETTSRKTGKVKLPKASKENYVSTTNACKCCKPLGATIAFAGIEGGISFLHGSQGCATYMRRYIISHFREPMDIASSSLGEKSAIYGGGPNLKKGLLTVMQKYEPKVIGVATTCLTETIGDDVNMYLKEFYKEFGEEFELPEIVHVSTPSYGGSHMEGFHAAVTATVSQLAQADVASHDAVNCFPGFVSAEDLRQLRDAFEHYGLPVTMLPDYSETLDGPALEDYRKIPEGGTPVSAIKAMGGAPASIQFSRVQQAGDLAGAWLREHRCTDLYHLPTPIGLRDSDTFHAALAELSGNPMPRRYELERGRLVDAMVDGHKYLSGRKVVIFGEEDMVVGLTSLAVEVGLKPVLVASGGESGGMQRAIDDVCADILPADQMPTVRDGTDFYEVAEEARTLAPDLLIGTSKGYRVLAKEMNIPLLRVGFPIHDRFGSQRVLHVGYQGAQRLLDQLVNTMIEQKQISTDIGYGYI